ncbi:MAG: HTH domain-containing protein [Euryarchaeota archaeon]|nr:HTH domain-containing protein [Euryarchaeota archaeon]
MKILSVSTTGGDVATALERALQKINTQLAREEGYIKDAQYSIKIGVSSVTVSITLALEGEMPLRKRVLGVNVRGYSREASVARAVKSINSELASIRGKVVSFYKKTVDMHLPGRVYTTIIVAVNEETLQEADTASARRSRLKQAIALLNNDPSAINIARVAEIFGVSRTVIYRDLETLGFQRSGDAQVNNHRHAGNGKNGGS